MAEFLASPFGIFLIIVAQYPGFIEGNDRPGYDRQNERNQWGHNENCAVRTGGDHDFLEDQLQHIGAGLQKPPGPNNVWPATHLNSRPNFTVRINQEVS